MGGTDWFGGGVVSVGFPQQLAYSMVRQRAEARLGLGLLLGAFCCKPLDRYSTWGLLRRGLAVDRSHSRQRRVGLLALVTWKVYVPWDEGRNRNSWMHCRDHGPIAFCRPPPRGLQRRVHELEVRGPVVARVAVAVVEFAAAGRDRPVAAGAAAAFLAGEPGAVALGLAPVHRAGRVARGQRACLRQRPL